MSVNKARLQVGGRRLRFDLERGVFSRVYLTNDECISTGIYLGKLRSDPTTIPRHDTDEDKLLVSPSWLDVMRTRFHAESPSIIAKDKTCIVTTTTGVGTHSHPSSVQCGRCCHSLESPEPVFLTLQRREPILHFHLSSYMPPAFAGLIYMDQGEILPSSSDRCHAGVDITPSSSFFLQFGSCFRRVGNPGAGNILSSRIRSEQRTIFYLKGPVNLFSTSHPRKYVTQGRFYCRLMRIRTYGSR